MTTPSFKVLKTLSIDAPPSPEWQEWGKCAKSLHERLPLHSYSVIEAPDHRNFMVIALRITGFAATNCHTYTDRLLSTTRRFLGNNVVLGIPVCGSNPQQIILENTTRVIAEELPQEPASLERALKRVPLRSGDILVWEDLSGTIAHATTLSHKSGTHWIADDKMDGRPPKKRSVRDIAAELYRPERPLAGDEEFHPERAPTNYRITVRRPK